MNEIPNFGVFDRGHKRLLLRPTGFTVDNTNVLNPDFNNREISLELPRPDDPSLVNRLFIRVDDQVLSVFDTTLTFDYFTSLTALSGGNTFRSVVGDAYVKKREQEILSSKSDHQFSIDIDIRQELERLLFAAEFDHDSRDALSVLINTAREGGEIAFVIAHGNIYHNPQSRKKEFHVIGVNAHSDINAIIRDFSSGQFHYQLVYFNACNPDDIGVFTGTPEVPVVMPVIVHKGDNKSMFEGYSKAQVYWPKNPRRLRLFG